MGGQGAFDLLGDRECQGTEEVGTVVAVTLFSSRSGWGPGRSLRQARGRNSLQGAPREVAGGWAGGVNMEGARASLLGACVSVQEEAGHSRGGRWRWARRVKTGRWGLPGARERELRGAAVGCEESLLPRAGLCGVSLNL